MNSFQEVNGYGGVGESPDGLGASLQVLGDELAPVSPAQQFDAASPARKLLITAYALSSVAGTAIGAYHGYKRNDSVGWAVAWAFLGGLFPVVVIPVAIAQGLGKEKR